MLRIDNCGVELSQQIQSHESKLVTFQRAHFSVQFHRAGNFPTRCLSSVVHP